MLDIRQVKEKYPLAYTKLLVWGRKYLSNFQNLMFGDVNARLPEINDSMVEKAMEGLAKVNFRILYDFFDENGQVISITHFNVNSFFSYIINGVVSSSQHKTRVGAEIDAFDEAFENINN